MARMLTAAEEAAKATKRESIYDATSDDTILRKKYPDKYELPGTGKMRSEGTLVAQSAADARAKTDWWAADKNPYRLQESVAADRIAARRKREYGD